MADNLCEYCGGDDESHPWPEDGPYLRGCILNLRQQIVELRHRLDDNGIYADGDLES